MSKTNNKKLLCIIPARAGSEAIKNKNELLIGDYSLVERALFVANGSKYIDKIIVSTNSDDIIDKVNTYGNFAPFKRPDEISSSLSPSIDFMNHAIDWVENNDNCTYEYIVLLEPPCPFRLPIHIDECYERALQNNITSLVSVIEVGDNHPIRMTKLNSNNELISFHQEEPDGLRRQDQDKVYIRNTAVYIFTRSTIKKGNLWGDRKFGYVMDEKLYGINIDEPIDYLLAKTFYDWCKENDILDQIEYIHKF